MIVRLLRRAWAASMRLGDWGGCHQLPGRSFFFRHYQFPVCARCTGVLAGQAVAGVLLLAGVRISPLWMGVLAIPMAADWLLQYFNIRPSTNPRRFVTGALFGAGYLFGVIELIGWAWQRFF